MIKNIILYTSILSAVFMFSIFYTEWFSWYLLIFIICTPLISLLFSLPFMIICSMNGLTAYTDNKIEIGDDFKISISGQKRPILFCPILRIDMKAENQFSKFKKRITLQYSGSLKKSVFEKYSKLSQKCGCVKINVKSCKVYDLTGIFFLPVRINRTLETVVLPPKTIPEILPEIDKLLIMGYKPKIGGGFSDYYELRNYQRGDSLKNIHWKLSSKSDKLIVREPSQPITKNLLIRAEFEENNTINDSIISRLIYSLEFAVQTYGQCYVSTNIAQAISSITNINDILPFIKSIFEKSIFNKVNIDITNCSEYKITAYGEEVYTNEE